MIVQATPEFEAFIAKAMELKLFTPIDLVELGRISGDEKDEMEICLDVLDCAIHESYDGSAHSELTKIARENDWFKS